MNPENQIMRTFVSVRLAMLAMLSIMIPTPSVAASMSDAKQNAAPEQLAAHVPKLRALGGGLLTGGQPDSNAWALLADEGVGTVINLRTDAEMAGSTEPSAVAAAGMDYLSIPVAGTEDVDRAHARRLWQAIAEADGKVLVHCASGNRVGALLAIGAAEARDLTPEQAVAYGRAAGLTRLEPRVRAVLATPADAAIAE